MAVRSGISTYQTYLMIKNGSTWEKLIDITSFPDLGDEPETIDTTTLTDNMMTFIPGIQSNSNMTFEANYTPDNYDAVHAYDDGQAYDVAIWFGADGNLPTDTPDGHDGKFTFTGFIKPVLGGGGVNEKVTMSVVVTPNSPIEFDVTAGGTITYNYAAVSSPATGANPRESGWYEQDAEDTTVYYKTHDIVVKSGKTYYTRTVVVGS